MKKIQPLMVAAALVLTGCGGGDSSTPGTGQPVTPTPGTPAAKLHINDYYDLDVITDETLDNGIATITQVSYEKITSSVEASGLVREIETNLYRTPGSSVYTDDTQDNLIIVRPTLAPYTVHSDEPRYWVDGTSNTMSYRDAKGLTDEIEMKKLSLVQKRIADEVLPKVEDATGYRYQEDKLIGLQSSSDRFGNNAFCLQSVGIRHSEDSLQYSPLDISYRTPMQWQAALEINRTGRIVTGKMGKVTYRYFVPALLSQFQFGSYDAYIEVDGNTYEGSFVAKEGFSLTGMISQLDDVLKQNGLPADLLTKVSTLRAQLATPSCSLYNQQAMDEMQALLQR